MACLAGERERRNHVMDPAPTLPRDIQQFLSQHIRTVHELEIVLLLYDQPARAWPAPAVAEKLYIPPELAVERLESLAAANLARRQAAEGQGATYQACPEHSTFMEKLSHTYRERRITMISFIFSQPDETVRSFADAFKLRKES
jgi:hypothetical protein